MIEAESEIKHEKVATDEKPPVNDRGQAIFIRDEKKAAVSKIFLEHLLLKKPMSPGLLEIRTILTASLKLSFLIQVMVAAVSTQLGDSAGNLATASFLILSAGLIELIIEENKPPKFFLVFYAAQFLLNFMSAGCGLLFLWSPSFCPNLASWFVIEHCQNNLNLIRAVGSLVLIFNVIFQLNVLCDFGKVHEYVKMIKNPKKQPSWVVVPNPQLSSS